MKVDDLKSYYNARNDADLAKTLKRPRSTIHYWRNSGIPLQTQAVLQLKTNGALKADLSSLEV